MLIRQYINNSIIQKQNKLSKETIKNLIVNSDAY